jgi:dephospho-CoA kinase
MKIAITGKMRVGKNTLADYFIEKEQCHQLAFGDGIKRVARAYFPHIVNQGKPRKLYQFIGQKFREIDPDVWVKDLDRTMINLMEQGVQNFIVTDVRQMNEYRYLKEKGFTIIKIEADDELRKERIIQAGDVFSPDDFYHETEIAVDSIPYDYLVTNNDTLDALYGQVVYIHNELRGEEAKWQTSMKWRTS